MENPPRVITPFDLPVEKKLKHVNDNGVLSVEVKIKDPSPPVQTSPIQSPLFFSHVLKTYHCPKLFSPPISLVRTWAFNG